MPVARYIRLYQDESVMTLPWSILPALNAKVSSGWSSIANSSSFMWLNVKKDSFTLKWTKKDET